MDANQDIQSRQMQTFMNNLNLKNAIFALHGNNCPSTTDTGESNKPIDILMCNSSLTPTNAGINTEAGSTSNHAWVWADFKQEDLFGKNYRDYRKIVYRLKADDPRMAKKYSSLSMNQINHEGISFKLEALLKIPIGFLNKDDIALFHTLLTRTTIIRQDTASKLRHIFNGNLPWSPEWKKAQNTKNLWFLVLRRTQIKQKVKKGKVSLTKIRRLMKLVNIRNILSLPLDVLETKYRFNLQEYKKACETAYKLADKHMCSLDEAKANENHTSVETEKKKRLNIQKQKEAGRALKILKRNERPMASKVFITTDEGRIECTDKESIEWACMKENKRRFTQVHDTPPMHQDILDWVGTCAENDAAEGILNGTEDPYLRLLLENMRRPNIVLDHGILSTEITLDEHRRGWRKQKIRTSSERSQLVFADFKAACDNKQLATLDKNFRQFPYKHGIANPAYSHFTDFQILKKAAVYDVEKMRTIQLMPAAFNMNNKKTGKEVMELAEKLNLLPDEQAGSRKGHRSNLTALNKVLTNDLIRARRLPSIIIFNDAKSCYERNLLWIAALALRRLGTSTPASLEMMRTLQTVKHKICTAYGDSKVDYGGPFLSKPLQGVGQGNGAGPAIWVAISTVLLTIMRQKGYGLSILSTLSFSALVMAGFAFVDDTDIIHSANDPHTCPFEVLQQAQTALNTWEGILRATGGAIGVNDGNKAFWYFLDFKFTANEWKYKNSVELPGELVARNYDNSICPLARLNPSIARETLGIFLAMDGNQRAQIEYLKSKARTYAEQLRTGVISKRHAWYSYTAAFSKTLEYPMEAIDIPYNDWQDIIKIFMGQLLQSSGIAKSAPRDLIFSDKQYNGLGIKHPYYTQAIIHIQTIMNCESVDPQTKKLLMTSWEESRWECGTFGHLTACPERIIKGISDTWIKNSLMFMINHDIEIEDSLPKLKPSREKDKSIMSCFSKNSEDHSILKKLNYCRQYLNVTTLSDITSTDGTTVCKWAWEGTKPDRWVNIPTLRRNPERKQLNWKLWRHHLNLLGMNQNSKKWTIPLGPWLNSNHQTWKYLFSRSNDVILAKHGGLYTAFSRLQQRRPSRSYSGKFGNPQIWHHHLPKDLVRADFHRRGSQQGHLIQVETTPNNNEGEQLHSTVNQLHILEETDEWALELILSDDSGVAIRDAIKEGTCLAISDGSFKNNRGTSAGIIEKQGIPESRLIVLNRVPGIAEDHSAYRAELAGVCGTITAITKIVQYYNIKIGKARIGLDGQSVLNRITNPNSIKSSMPSYDLLRYITDKVKTSPINIEFFWVKGHQDDFGEVITYEGHLNIQCDALAKQYWNATKRHNDNCLPTKVNSSGFVLKIDGEYQSSLDKKYLYDATYGKLVSLPYETTRIPLLYGHHDDINWKAIGKAVAGFPLGQRQWFFKQLSGCSATAKVMKRRKRWTHNKCPICFREVEDSDHVLSCKGKAARTAWKDSVQQLVDKLEEIDTEPFICIVIKDRLMSWPKVPKEKFKYDTLPKETRIALDSQDKLGWKPFIYGRVATTWEDAQEKWLIRLSTRYKRSSQVWSTTLVQQLLQTQWNMWENRNEILHNKDHIWQKRKRALWDEEIYTIFNSNIRESFLQEDMKFFKWGRNKVIELDDNPKQQWLKSIEKARTRKTVKENAPVRGASNALRNWLQT